MTNQHAINILKGLEQSLDDYCELNDEGKAAFRMAVTALELFGNSEQLPSAQPAYTDEEIQKMQELEQAKFEKAYQLGYEEGKKDAQPEPREFSCGQENDMISRQMILEYIHGEPVGKLLCDKYNLDGLIERFPPAQPEIIRCKDCKYYDPNDHCYLQGAEAYDFCSYAERRNDD